MKKNITIILILLVQNLWATEKDSTRVFYKNYFRNQLALIEDDCDACSSSGSGGSMGFGSMLNTNFIGVRYFNQQYKSTEGLYSNSPWYTENYNTMQLWGIVPIKKKFQLVIQIPYQFHNRETENRNLSMAGLGDITTVAMCKLIQTRKDSVSYSHSLKIGAGVKAPTGKYNQNNSVGINPSFQLGTGSWDYSFLSEYVIKRKQFGLNTMFNYIVKTENKKYYRFGNQLNYASTVFYSFKTDTELSFVPQLGVAGEIYDQNHQYSEVIRFTKGDVLFGKLGFELGKNKFSLGANVMLPIHQNLASGRVQAISRWSVNLNYSL